MIFLKSLALFSVMLLFANPVLSLLKESNTGINLVIIDNSRSLEIDNRLDERNQILKENYNQESKYFYALFSDQISGIDNVIPSLSDSGLGSLTSLTPILKKLRENYGFEDINTITLISDGIFNHGGNPIHEARLFQIPFITVMLGDTVQKKDLVAWNVICNEKAFTNTPVKIKAEINAYGYNREIAVNLLRENKIIATRNVKVEGKKNLFETEFTVSESQPSKIRYRIQVEPVENELTIKNNQYDFFITYFEKKNKILLISGGPGYDHEFIISVIRRVSEYKTISRTLKSSEEFYEGRLDRNSFNEPSLVILLNFPSEKTSASLSNNVSDNIRYSGIPVLFIAGRNSDYNKLRSYEFLPFEANASVEKQSPVKTITNPDNPFTDIASSLNSSPPLFRNISALIIRPGTETYISDRFTGEPVMVYRSSGEVKSSAFLNYGLWRWQLNASSDVGKNLEKLILKLIELSIEKESKTRFRIYPQKDIFDYMQKPLIIAEARDENNNLTVNASVTGKVISSAGKEYPLVFSISGMKYHAILHELPPGDYKVEASAELNGAYLGSDNSRFLSDTLKTEYMMTRSDLKALQELASNTGGYLVKKENYNSIREITDSISASIFLDKTVTEKIKLKENIWMLVIIIMFFATEWIMRKRNNIP